MPHSSPSIIEITKDTPNFNASLEEMSILLSFAFSEPLDPMIISAVGVSYENNPELHHLFHRVELEAAFTGAGRVFGAFIDTNGVERLAGVAIWYGPGKQFLDDDEQLGYWLSFSKKLSPETQQWWEEMLARFSQLAAEGLGVGVQKGLFHLLVLGVHPEFHRRGVGKALVSYMLERSDSQGIASCVSTSNETNLLFYISLGFEVKSKKGFPSPHGGFTRWCLMREPGVGNRPLSNE